MKFKYFKNYGIEFHVGSLCFSIYYKWEIYRKDDRIQLGFFYLSWNN